MSNIGIYKKKNGGYGFSVCKSKPGNEGLGRCHHFKHVNSPKAAEQYIRIMVENPNMAKIIDFDRDFNSLEGGLESYATVKGKNAEKQDNTSAKNIVKNMFGGNIVAARDAISKAEKDGVIPHINATASVKNGVKELAKNHVSFAVCADKITDLKDNSSAISETAVWSLANGVDEENSGGEDSPLLIMVANGEQENNTVNSVRNHHITDSTINNGLTPDEREELEKANYVLNKQSESKNV